MTKENYMKNKVLDQVIYRYPQLIFRPEQGLCETEDYRRIVRKGIMPAECPNRFINSEKDEFSTVATPVGGVDVLYLYEREDFEQAVRILAFKGEPVELPFSMGAITVQGIINWRKILSHRARYEEAGGRDWKSEFKAFTSDACNYRDTLVILSEGNYSAVSGDSFGIERQEWLEISREIRTWHELTHVFCRKCYPENRHAVRDELVADCIGLTKALGTYDRQMAKCFLGIESAVYRAGGRLENYLQDGESPEDLARKTSERIEALWQYCSAVTVEPWERLRLIEENRIGFLEE